MISTFVILVLCFVQFQAVESCVYGDGTGCRFPCRCTTGGCDPVTGMCTTGGCAEVLPSEHDYGWKGVGCRTGNIAYNKVTSQSGVWNGHTSDRAVDGNTDPNINKGSCSHPETSAPNTAWWMVDLGKKHVIEEIVIFNRNSNQYRTNNFDIRIGMTSTIDDQDLCMSYNGEKQDVIPLTCTEDVLEGRYVSMRRQPGGDNNDPEIINICEFVVIGYEPIECGHNCSGSCDRLTGCDTCDEGFKLPDCIDECDSGTWGTNCGSQCGQCSGNTPCDRQNGECLDGCEQWYLEDKCNVHIEIPHLNTSLVKIDAVSSSVISVTWQQGDKIPNKLADYYFYQIEYWPAKDATRLSSMHIIHKSATGSETVSFNLTDLIFNTEYEVIVVPYRVHNEIKEAGISSIAVRNRTQCTEPHIPSVTVTNDKEHWKLDCKVEESGCDSIISYNLYILANDGQTVLQNRSILSESFVTLPYNISYNGSDVWTEVVNNENMARSSMKVKLTYTIHEQAAASQLNIGAIAGGAAGCVVVAVVIGVVIFVVLGRRRSPKSDTRNANTMINSSSNLVMNETAAPLKPIKGAEDVYVNAGEIAFASTCVKVSQLEDYIQHRQQEVDGLNHEYTSIPAGYIHPVTKASESKTVNKNRFKNIRAYDKSRVVLEAGDDEQAKDYINACFIPGYNGDSKHYIAGQGPLPHTIADHWRMIWQCNITRIIMATREVELGKKKCERYWPDKVGEAKEFGPFTVALREVEEYADYTIRKLKCSKSDESKNVTQFHFTSWPDKTALEDTWPLLQFRHKVKSYPVVGPLFVHCSAGIGRTGTYIAIDFLLEQGSAEDKLDVYQCVANMREYRMNMVQTLAQYEFIYKSLVEAFAFGDTWISCVELDSTLQNKTSLVAKQYQYITKWTNSLSSSVKTYDAQSQDNKKKNRDMSIIPTDSYRPYLKTQWKGTNDYINAVYVDSYSRQKAFIVTQFPLSNTVIDFWRLVYDQNCGVIVSLGVMESGQKAEPQGAEAVYENFEEKNAFAYLPKEEAKPEMRGPFEVVVTQQFHESCLTTRKITVQISKHDNKVDTTNIEMQEWENGQLPQIDTFMEVIKQVEQLKLENGGPVLISCLNGADKSGLLAAALYMVEYMKLEQEVDVVTAVRSVRKYRPQFISNQKQFEYLYQVAQSYSKMFSTYANYL